MQEMKSLECASNTHSPSKIKVHSLKQSILMTNTIQPCPQLFINQPHHIHPNTSTSPIKNPHPLNLSTQYIKTDSNNQTTYDNSLAIKNQPHITKSMMYLKQHQHNNQSQEKSLSSQNHSINKRKKFISVTQKNILRTYHSQHKVRQNNNKQTSSIIAIQSSQSEIKPTKQSFIQKQQQQKQQQFSISQFITPAKSLKQYLSSVINTISKHQQAEQQQRILNQDDINQNNVSSKMLSSSEKAKQQRNQMKNAMLLHERELQRINGKYLRMYTERNQTHKKNQTSTSSPLKQHFLMTEPNQPSQSRNFMVFEEKIGQNTLTRKDSLILALMENMSQNERVDENYSHKSQFAPLSIETPHKPKKSISLFTQQSTQIPPVLHEKLKQKTQSHQQRPKQSTKIKFISLMQKQQSIRYKNCIDQNIIKDQFINLQRKSQKIKQLPL